MSGALVQLVSKGVQDAYLTNDAGMSLFKTKYQRHSNFSFAPKKLDFTGQAPTPGGQSSIILKNHGDLVNYMWLESSSTGPGSAGTHLATQLTGTIFELYIGGQKVDSQPIEYITDVWDTYLADTYSKSGIINNKASPGYPQFLPFHFFFCDFNSYIPLVALQYHEVEIRCLWGTQSSVGNDVTVFANYVYIDTAERAEMTNKTMEFIITQVQTLPVTFNDGLNSVIDLSNFNHPVKSLFFGVPVIGVNPEDQVFSFDQAEFQINGTTLFEMMTPVYFYLVQSYFHTDNSFINWNLSNKQPATTRFYMYNFCLSATSYKPTGTCNFSRIDNAKLVLQNIASTLNSVSTSQIGSVFAVNYNVLKIQNGLGGILFGN